MGLKSLLCSPSEMSRLKGEFLFLYPHNEHQKTRIVLYLVYSHSTSQGMWYMSGNVKTLSMNSPPSPLVGATFLMPWPIASKCVWESPFMRISDNSIWSRLWKSVTEALGISQSPLPPP